MAFQWNCGTKVKAARWQITHSHLSFSKFQSGLIAGREAAVCYLQVFRRRTEEGVESLWLAQPLICQQALQTHDPCDQKICMCGKHEHEGRASWVTTWRKALSWVLLLSRNFWSMDLNGSLLSEGNCNFFNDGKHWEEKKNKDLTDTHTCTNQTALGDAF